MVGVITRTVQSLFFVIKSDGYQGNRKLFPFQLSQEFDHNSNAGCIVACRRHAWTLAIIVRAQEYVSIRRADLSNDVAPAAAKVLNLNVGAKIQKRLCNVFRGSSRALCAGMSSLRGRIRQEGYMRLEPIDRYSGYRYEPNNQRGSE